MARQAIELIFKGDVAGCEIELEGITCEALASISVADLTNRCGITVLLSIKSGGQV